MGFTIYQKPNFIGVNTFNNYSLEEIAKYIDWTPFFIAWEMKGKYPAIFENDKYGVEAKNYLMMPNLYCIKL
ncbi:MAG: hypothetical protein H6613_04330 [Ignavibacteriales bacterium]|nr:hypothetical protein [Ignavibacteriales bacterium]